MGDKETTIDKLLGEIIYIYIYIHCEKGQVKSLGECTFSRVESGSFPAHNRTC